MLYSSHPANSRRQFWTQQARVGGFVCDAAHGGKLLVDRIGCQPTRFEVHAITSNHDPVEGEPRFRAVPCYELVESEFVDAVRTG